MKYVLLCAAYSDGKVRELRTFTERLEVSIYSKECSSKGWNVETVSIPIEEDEKVQPHAVQYSPPPRWGGRVVCVETGWIFKTIAAAAHHMNGSQWALRKAVVRNTIYHGYHWRMYCDQGIKIDKFQ